MKVIKNKWLITAVVCLAVLLIVTIATGFWSRAPKESVIRIGFVYSEDESTPYTANFIRAQYALEAEFVILGYRINCNAMLRLVIKRGVLCDSQ